MGKGRVVAAGFLLLALVFGFFLHRRSGVFHSTSGMGASTSLVPVDEKPLEENELIFAGVSGESPKYIDSGPNRGLGWAEYQIREVKRALEEAGFKIRQEYFTPARIAHEIKMKTPLCTYPVEWSNPVSRVKSEREKLFSIPIDLSGEEKETLLVHKRDLERFKKYRDAQGDINLDALLRDSTLQTVLVRDKEYATRFNGLSGTLAERLFYTDKNGDQQVKKEYSHSVSIFLPRVSKQIVEMFNAHRFDYLFYGAQERLDLKELGIDPNLFAEVPFYSTRIQDENNAGVKLISVACSESQVTVRALPYINQAINAVRGYQNSMRWFSYKKRVDPSQSSVSPYNSTVYRLQNPFSSGGLDTWYDFQIAKVPGLKLYPASHSLQFRSRVQKNQIFSVSSKSTLVLAGAFPQLSSYLPYDAHIVGDVEPREIRRELKKEYFTPEEVAYLNEPHFQRKDRMSPVGSARLERPKPNRLTLIGYGQSEESFQELEPIITPALSELTAIGLGSGVSQNLLKRLPEHLQVLNLTGCQLAGLPVHLAIRRLPLKVLRLSSTSLSAHELQLILRDLPESIEVLSFANLKRAWTVESARLFGQRKFASLRILDLEGTYLQDTHLNLMLKSFSPTLTHLRLGSGFFTPRSIRNLLKLELSHLMELDLSGDLLTLEAPTSLLEISPSQEIKLPKKLKRLGLARSGITLLNSEAIQWPDSLEFVDLGENRLSEKAFDALLTHLSPQTEALHFGQMGITQVELKKIISAPNLRTIGLLDLRNNNLDDASLRVFSQGQVEIRGLNLAQNRLSNEGARSLPSRLFSELTVLSIGQNPLSKLGLQFIFNSLSSKLTSLDLTDSPDISAEELASVLSTQLKNLKSLKINEYPMTDREICLLAPHLPDSLEVLSMNRSLFQRDGIPALVRHLPKNLRHLTLDLGNSEESAFLGLASELPQSLWRLELNRVKFSTQGSTEGWFKSIPKGTLAQSYTNSRFVGANAIELILDSFSPSLRYLNLFSTSFHPERQEQTQVKLPLRLDNVNYRSMAGGLNDLLSLPISLGTFFLSSQCKQSCFDKLLSLDLSSLYYIGFFGSAVPTARDAVEFIRKNRGIPVIELSGLKHTRSDDFDSLTREDLASVHNFTLGNSAYSNKTVVKLLKKLPESTVALYLPSLNLTYDGVDALIEALPKNLKYLLVAGNQIGEKGSAKLRAYQKMRQERDQVVFTLDE